MMIFILCINLLLSNTFVPLQCAKENKGSVCLWMHFTFCQLNTKLKTDKQWKKDKSYNLFCFDNFKQFLIFYLDKAKGIWLEAKLFIKSPLWTNIHMIFVFPHAICVSIWYLYSHILLKIKKSRCGLRHCRRRIWCQRYQILKIEDLSSKKMQTETWPTEWPILPATSLKSNLHCQFLNEW